MTAVLRSSNGHRHLTDGGRDIIPIPILRKRLGRWLIPCASSPIVFKQGEFVEHVNKRINVDEPEILAESARIQMNTTGGEFKSYRIPVRCFDADRIAWFAVAVPPSGKSTGAMSHLRCTLRKVFAIGSKISIGYGVVTRWTVEEVADDFSWFAPSDRGSVLMRPLPAGEWLPKDMIGHVDFFDAPCGPYWDASNYTEVVKPC